jgi:hypothetical protein
MAEFFRRAPELIDFQDDLNIVLFELDLEVQGKCLEVLDQTSRVNVGITLERLTSSEPDETARYRECRQLAHDVEDEGHSGIMYPSAAAAWPAAGNLVLFGEQDPGSWECHGHREVARPRLMARDVNPLPPK